MRIRSIKPEFWRSRHVAQLPWDLRLLFIGLWSYVDDNGVGIDDPWQITADVFPVEPDPAVARKRVEEGLARLSREVREPSPMPFIVRYTVDGKGYLYITGWPHQRIDKPSRSRYPGPDSEGAERVTSENVESSRGLPECSRSPLEKTPTGTGEQGNRGTDKRLPRSARRDDRFDEFWSTYPRREGKGAAEKAWVKALKEADVDDVLKAAAKFANLQAGQELKYIAHPATWLNQKRWLDEPAKPSTPRLWEQ